MIWLLFSVITMEANTQYILDGYVELRVPKAQFEHSVRHYMVALFNYKTNRANSLT